MKVRTTVPPPTTTLPKSVWSAVLGVVSPSQMLTTLPVTFISGESRYTMLLVLLMPLTNTVTSVQPACKPPRKGEVLAVADQSVACRNTTCWFSRLRNCTTG